MLVLLIVHTYMYSSAFELTTTSKKKASRIGLEIFFSTKWIFISCYRQKPFVVSKIFRWETNIILYPYPFWTSSIVLRCYLSYLIKIFVRYIYNASKNNRHTKPYVEYWDWDKRPNIHDGQRRKEGVSLTCTTIDLKMFARVTKDRQMQSLIYTRGLVIDLY